MKLFSQLLPGLKQPPTAKFSLQRFLLNWLRAVVIAALLIISLGVTLFVTRIEAQSWRDRENEAAISAAQTIAIFMNNNYEAMTAAGHWRSEMLLQYPEILSEMLQRNPALLEIVRLNDRGIVLAKAYRDRPVITDLFTIPQSSWFQKARAGKQYLGEVEISAGNDPFIILAIPTDDKGVVAARLEMKLLRDVVTNIHFGSTGHTYIVDKAGQVVAHPQTETYNSQAQLTNMAMFQTILAAPQNQWHGSFRNFAGNPVVGSSAVVPGTDWIVITEISQGEAFQISIQAIIILGGTTSVAGLIMVLLARHLLQTAIFRPLSALQIGVERIGKGELNYRIPIFFRDEIGDVAEAFNHMTVQLNDREMALKLAHQETLQASQFKTRLLANVGHDVRTPINSILGYSDILNEGVYGPLNKQQQKANSRILFNARRLLILINSILDEAQIEAGKITLHNEAIALRDILQCVRDALEIPAQSKGLTLQTTCDASLPEQVIGDLQRLQQIAMNLAENGLKFTQQGSISVCLEKPDTEHWAIVVSDTGTGIPEEAQEYIFEAFRQIDGSTTRENKGIGLGLSIVKQLTLLIGGTVKLHSQLGLGSTFTVVLPLVTVDEVAGLNPMILSNEEMKQ